MVGVGGGYDRRKPSTASNTTRTDLIHNGSQLARSMRPTRAALAHAHRARPQAPSVDVHGQQLDFREKHSWVLRMHEVETPELVEVFP